jgi:hypothetical protein
VAVDQSEPWLIALAGIGIAGGLFLLARGMAGYRTQIHVADIATSAIDSIAGGEIRISGTVEPAELMLISLLQSRPCVYYRSSLVEPGEIRHTSSERTEERSIGFRIRDGSGALRVFPNGARFDAPVRFEGETGEMGDEPPGLEIRRGGSTRATETDRAAAIAELLRVRDPDEWSLLDGRVDRRIRRGYREWRIELGDAVTVVGQAVPFGDLSDPVSANVGEASGVDGDDPEVAADLAVARASGSLAGDAATAWGNAAIPGFGIGRPVSRPRLDPAATQPSLASPEEAARASETFEIEPGTLVLAASEGGPLLIAYGTPGVVAQRGKTQLLVGLLGAILAIASAVALAVLLDGGLTR